jgi:hypothetical protein
MRLWLSLLLLGCAGSGFPDILEPHEMPSSLGAPSIDRVRDAGNLRVPVAGAWKPHTDGVACPGELVVIEGDNFGRLPTVSIGGRATAVLARTDGGGIVARVPAGVPAGKINVSVSQPKGKSERELMLRRLAVVVHAGKLHFLEEQHDGIRPVGQPLAIPGAQTVRLSSDGATAYVLAGDDRLVAVDLTTLAVSRELKLLHKTRTLSAAADVPLLFAVGDSQLTLISTQLSHQPAAYPPVELPKEMRGARAVEVSPTGKLLAGLVPEGNRLVMLEVQENPPALRLYSAVELLPTERLPLVRDLSWSSDGETLWIVSGDNAQSLPAVQPTRLTAVRIVAKDKNSDGKADLLSVWRTQSIPGATAPLRVMVARGQPLASGTTIRMPPEKAAVFISSVSGNLFKLAESTVGPAVFEKLWRPARPAMIVRADINGGGGPLFASPHIMSSVDLTPDSQWVVATAARVAPSPATRSVVLDFGVMVSPVWGSPMPVFVSLGTLDPGELKPPFAIGEVRIQP